MKKLSEKFKNVPTNAPQVCSTTSSSSNKVQRLSVKSKVLSDNTPEVDLLQSHTGGQNLRVSVVVYVLNQHGVPLMPCSSRTARVLIRKSFAKVVKRLPFTIQLDYSTGETLQEVKLGIDTGYENVGASAISPKDELFSATLILDGKTKSRLDEKRMYRRGRRSRHHWYRKSRFMNRKTEENHLPPSTERRYRAQLTLIEKIKDILPISKYRITIEVGNFDIQKLMNPEIEGKDYQLGDLYEYQNVRSYLLSREKGKCEYCKKDFKSSPSHIHHRKPKGKKGCNRLENLMLVHKKCHKDIHKNPKLLKKYEKSSVKEYKATTFMNIIKNRFQKDIEDLKITYGYITFVNRNKLGLEKSHINDAFVIAGGTTQNRVKPFEIIQKHRNNRVLQTNRKGFAPSIRRSRSRIQSLDLFWVKGKKYVCKTMFGYGKYILYGEMKKKEYFKAEQIEKFFSQGSFVWNI